MAGNFGTAVIAQAATTTSARTMLRLSAPAHQGLRVNRLSVSFKGTSPTADKIKVEVVKGSTGGTSSALTVQKIQGHAGTLQATATQDFSAEPAGGTVVASELVHPQGGYTFPEEFLIVNETLGIRVTAAASVNMEARMRWEE